MQHRRLVVGGLVWAVVVFGGGVVSAAVGVDEERTIDPYTRVLIDQAVDDDYPEDIAECFSFAIVDAVGVEVFEEKDVDPEELDDVDGLAEFGIEPTEEGREHLRQALERCGIVEFEARRFVDDLEEEFLGPDDSLSAETAACVRDHLTGSAVIAEGMALAFYDPALIAGIEADAEAAFVDVFAVCPDVFAAGLVAQVESEGVEIDDDVRACIEEGMATRTDQIREAMRREMETGESTGPAELAVVMAQCPGFFAAAFEAGALGSGLDDVPADDAQVQCMLDAIAAIPSDELVALIGDGSDLSGVVLRIGPACLMPAEG